MNYNLSRPIQLTQAEKDAALDAITNAHHLHLSPVSLLARILDAINRTARQANSPTPKHPAPQPDSHTHPRKCPCTTCCPQQQPN